jgi:hypothetical protein
MVCGMWSTPVERSAAGGWAGFVRPVKCGLSDQCHRAVPMRLRGIEPFGPASFALRGRPKEKAAPEGGFEGEGLFLAGDQRSSAITWFGS